MKVDHCQIMALFALSLFLTFLSVPTASALFEETNIGIIARTSRKPIARQKLLRLKKSIIYYPPGSEAEAYANKKRLECLSTMQSEYRRIVGSFISGHNAVLLEMVDHDNLGDSFIQIGEMLLMKELGSPPKYACTMRKCNLIKMKEILLVEGENSIVLVNGGGNLGDLWRDATNYKHLILQVFYDIPIVFLPQSVSYAKETFAEYDSYIFNQHHNLTIMLRDKYSLDYCRSHFLETPSMLAPDGAMMIGPIDSSRCVPRWDVMVLSRRDWEKKPGMGLPKDVRRVFRQRNMSFVITDWFGWEKHLGHRELPDDVLDWAEWRLRIGVDYFCLARAIVTDRLHGTILSTLMGIPHVFLDNVSGKVSAFRRSNFGPVESCGDKYLRGYEATSWREAAHIAAILLGK